MDIENLVALSPATLRELKLPNMNEFSPGVLEDNNIKHLLDVLSPHVGDKEAMINAITSRYTRIARTRESQRDNRANNVLVGMSQCGVLVKEGGEISPEFTPLAREIQDSPGDALANARFARHLLEDCGGLELLDIVAVIRARGEAVSDQSIREELRSRGFVVTENESNHGKIRQWLESTEIVDSNWNVNNERLLSLTGASTSTLGKWYSLPRSQRVFLEKLRFLDSNRSGEWIPVREIKKLAESKYQRSIFPEGKLRAAVIAPLVEDGWLEARGTGDGRGGDSGQVHALGQLRDLKIKLPFEGVTAIPVDLRDKLSKPLETIFQELGSSDKHIKGIALELLALRLIRDIGLYPVCFRERSARTQGAEVDLVANSINLHYSRWLIQCKNTSQVHVHDIAKEVGMAVVLKAQVIVLVTTGTFGRTVRTYADGLSSSSALQAILIDREILNKYRNLGATPVIDWLRSSAFRVLTLKESQVREYEE